MNASKQQAVSKELEYQATIQDRIEADMKAAADELRKNAERARLCAKALREQADTLKVKS